MSGERDTQRERLRRAAEDGERLYRVRMHGEPTARDENRIDGILSIDLLGALGSFDSLLAEVDELRSTVATLRKHIEEQRIIANHIGREQLQRAEKAEAERDRLRDALAKTLKLVRKMQSEWHAHGGVVPVWFQDAIGILEAAAERANP
jgi:hypothetical protein